MAKQVHYHCWIALPHRQVNDLERLQVALLALLRKSGRSYQEVNQRWVEFPKPSDRYTKFTMLSNEVNQENFLRADPLVVISGKRSAGSIGRER